MGFFSSIIQDSRLRVSPANRGLSNPVDQLPTAATGTDYAMTTQRDNQPKPNRQAIAPNGQSAVLPRPSAATAESALSGADPHRSETFRLSDGELTDTPSGEPLSPADSRVDGKFSPSSEVQQQVSISVYPIGPPLPSAVSPVSINPGPIPNEPDSAKISPPSAEFLRQQPGVTSSSSHNDVGEISNVTTADAEHAPAMPVPESSQQSDLTVDPNLAGCAPESKQLNRQVSPARAVEPPVEATASQIPPPVPQQRIPLEPLRREQAQAPSQPQVRIGQVTVVVEGPNPAPARARPRDPSGPGERQLLRGL